MIVNINNTSRVYNGFLQIDKAELQYEKFDGTLSQKVMRENCFRGDSVAILLYDLNLNKLLLIRQFRYPVYCADKKKAWLLELPAGCIDKGESPMHAVKRELQEEVNLTLDDSQIKYIFTVFPSPGGTSEQITIYTAETDLLYLPKNGGVIHEGEDIQSVLLQIPQALDMMEKSIIKDAKTIIALQWLKMNL